MKPAFDNQVVQINANKFKAEMEKAKDKEMMNLQTQKREEEEKLLKEYERRQQELCKQALDEQVPLRCAKLIGNGERKR